MFQASHVQKNHVKTKENVAMLEESSRVHALQGIMGIDVRKKVLNMYIIFSRLRVTLDHWHKIVLFYN
jgi:hypothetical protein